MTQHRVLRKNHKPVGTMISVKHGRYTADPYFQRDIESVAGGQVGRVLDFAL